MYVNIGHKMTSLPVIPMANRSPSETDPPVMAAPRRTSRSHSVQWPLVSLFHPHFRNISSLVLRISPVALWKQGPRGHVLIPCLQPGRWQQAVVTTHAPRVRRREITSRGRAVEHGTMPSRYSLLHRSWPAFKLPHTATSWYVAFYCSRHFTPAGFPCLRWQIFALAIVFRPCCAVGPRGL